MEHLERKYLILIIKSSYSGGRQLFSVAMVHEVNLDLRGMERKEREREREWREVNEGDRGEERVGKERERERERPHNTHTHTFGSQTTTLACTFPRPTAGSMTFALYHRWS